MPAAPRTLSRRRGNSPRARTAFLATGRICARHAPRTAGTSAAQPSGMDTTTSYLGLRLAHPFVAGAAPMGYSLDTLKRLEDAGCAAVVLHSLFEEQISLATEGRVAHVDPLDARFANAIADYPPPTDY